MNEQTNTLQLAPAPSTPVASTYVLRIDDPPNAGRPRDGDYFLRAFDADANEGTGAIELTGALDRALKFSSPVEAFEFWKHGALLRLNAEVMTSDGRATICRRCIEYVATGGVKQVYEYLPPDGLLESGATIYIDVEAASKIVRDAGRLPNWEDNPANLLPHVLAHEIYEPHLPHVPTSRERPGLMLRFVFHRLDDGRLEEFHVFADGNHRLASDLATGALPFFFYALDADESRAVSTLNVFHICREQLLEDLSKLSAKTGERPAELFDRFKRQHHRLYVEATGPKREGETRPTMTEVNRIRALRDAAYVLTSRTEGEPYRHCPDSLSHHVGSTCSLCGQKD